MKKFILSAVLPLLYSICAGFFPAAGFRARAEEPAYACILSQEVYLYSEESETSGLFILPYTYYVKVLSPGVRYSKVEYLSDGPSTKRVAGYCKTSELTFVDYIPVRPYLYYTFELTYRLENTQSDSETDDFLTGITVTCAYYGDYRVGSKVYCYILRDGTFGYIPKPSDISYDLNDEYANRNTSEEPNTAAGNFGDKESMSPAQIAILVLLCILVPVIAALILRPPKKPPYEADE